MGRTKQKPSRRERFDALAADALRMQMAGLTDDEIAQRLNITHVRDFIDDGSMLALQYEFETLPTTLTLSEVEELAALEQERFPSQRHWLREFRDAMSIPDF